MAVVGEDDLAFGTAVVVEGDVEFVGESVDDGGADAKAGEGAGAGEEGDLSEVLPSLVVFFEVGFESLEELFGHFPAEAVRIFPRFVGLGVFEADFGGEVGSVKIELHKVFPWVD